MPPYFQCFGSPAKKATSSKKLVGFRAREPPAGPPPYPMLTLDRTAHPLALREDRSAQPPLLGGLLFAALEVVPLTAPGPFTALRVVGVLVLLALAVGLILHARPKTLRRPLPARPGVTPERLELGGEELPPLYRVTLVLSDGSRHTVLEGPEPSRVLEDAAALGKTLGVAFGDGWGLSAPALNELLATSPVREKRFTEQDAFTLEHPPLPGQRAAAYTTLWASAFVLVASFVMSDGPERHGLVPSALSIVLPCLSANILLVLGFWLLGLRERVTVTKAGVTRRRLWFKSELTSVDSREVAILGAALVRPGARSDGHLLLASEKGLFALPAAAPDGATLLEKRAGTTPAAERAAE